MIDFDFFFDIGPEYNHCLLKHDTHDYYFEEDDHHSTQIIMSDRVPNCYLDALERQDWF